MDQSIRHVLMKQGVLGIRVKIMHGWDPEGRVGRPFPLPDAVTILEPKDEEPITAPVSESRNQPPAVDLHPGQPELPAQPVEQTYQAPPQAGAF